VLLVAAALVVTITILPWKQADATTYKGFDSNLLYAESTGNPGVSASSPSVSSVDINSMRAIMAPGPHSQVATHLVTSLDDFSATFDATVNVDNSLASAQPISVTVTKPATARYFVVVLAAANTSIQFGEVAINPVNGGDATVTGQGFHETFQNPKLPGWIETTGVTSVLALSLPGGRGLLIDASGTSERKAWTAKAIGPVPVSENQFSVSAVVHRISGTGPFTIKIDWLDSTRHHIAFNPNWQEWAEYQGTAMPIDVRLWYPAQGNSIDIRFVDQPTRQIVASIYDGRHESRILTMGPYVVGETYRFLIKWTSESEADMQVVMPDGRTIDYLVDRSSGLALFSERYVNLSVGSTAVGQPEAIEISNLALTLPSQSTFALKVADPRLVIASLAIIAWFASFILFHGFRRVVRWVDNRSGKRALGAIRRWVQRFGAPAVLTVVAIALLYVPLTVIDAFPYDRLAQEGYAYVTMNYGLGDLYGRTSAAPDAAVRGGHSPWSNTPFAYPPLMAYPYWVAGTIWQAVGGVIEPLRDRAYQVFWKSLFAGFVLVDALILFAILRRDAERRWAVAGTALFVLNPALLFDTAIWGETEAILLAALLAAAFGFATGRSRLGWTSLIVATLIKQTALLAAPVFAIYAIKRYGFRRTVIDGSWGLLLSFALVLPFILLGYSPWTIVKVNLAQVSSFAAPPPNYASSDTFSLWSLVNGLHGLHGFDRIWAPFPLSFSWASYATTGTIVFAAVMIAVVLKMAFTPVSRLSANTLYVALAAVVSSYVILSTYASGRYLVLALPFLILALRSFGPFTRVWMVAALSGIALISMYGIYMVVAVTGDWPQYYGLGNPNTNVLSGVMYRIYTADFAMSAFAILLLLLATTLLFHVWAPPTRASRYAARRVNTANSDSTEGGK
jgi:Gpi18-like mannosyltransferase